MHDGGEKTIAIMIREFVENKHKFATNISNYKNGLNVKESDTSPSVDTIQPGSLMVEIEGIHAAPFATRNYTRYMPQCLKKSVPLWTEPYRRPLIKHHNEENGEPIGRIVNVEYLKSDTRSGTPALKFTVNVPDKDAIEAVKNGLLLTTSIGCTAHDVRCSVCGKSIVDAEEGCPSGHQRGASYDTDDGMQTCYWDIYEMEPKEISYVDVPSDMYAKNINMYSVTNTSLTQIKESVNNSIVKGAHRMDDKEKIKELENKIKTLEAKEAELTASIKKSETQISEATQKNEELTKKVSDLEETNKKFEETIKESEQLKDSIEKEIADTKAEMKESLSATVIMMREALGNTVDAEAIKNRSIDSLKDSILDMKESFLKIKTKKEEKKDGNENVKDKVGSVKDPTIIDTKESEERREDEIDLKAGLKDIFSSVVSFHG